MGCLATFIKTDRKIFTLLSILILYGSSFAQITPENINDSAKQTDLTPGLLLQKYIAIPSISGNEEKAAAFLMEKSRSLGLVVEEMRTHESGVNFAASLYPLEQKKPNIIFLNHIDVVPAGDSEDWKFPPFGETVRDGKIYGRGAIDNKSLGIIHLLTVASFVEEAKEKNLPYNITMLSVSGEETGGKRGSCQVVENFYEELNPVVVFGEGGSGIEETGFLNTNGPAFGIAIAERSFLWLEVKIELNSMGHASINTNDYANKSLINGLYRMLSKRQKIQFTPASEIMFYNLGEIEGGIRGFIFKHVDWPVFRPILKHQIKQKPELASLLSNSYTLSYFGSSHVNVNQNAQKSSALIDCRILPGNNANDVLKMIQKELGDTSIHVKIIEQGPQAYCTVPDQYFVMMAGAIKMIYPGAEVVPIMFPASSDNNYFRARGCPVYGINPHLLHPDQIKSIHNTDENIDIDEMEKGIEVMKTFLSLAIKERESGVEFKQFVSNIPVICESDNLILPTK